MKEVRIDKKMLYLFNNGKDYKSYLRQGAHKAKVGGEFGYNFMVWAPRAIKVYLVGDFNNWESINPMTQIKDNGMWQLFIPGLKDKEKYKYLIVGENNKKIFKADPYAFYSEKRPNTASITYDLSYVWNDEGYSRLYNHFDAPMNIYEMHLGSWKRTEDNLFLNYREIAPILTEYLIDMNYTHVEFLPIMEHPFDGSWGYQITGYYAPTSRYGEPNDFKYLVDVLHQNGIKVILDWVPGHFCKDSHGLANFDGQKLYEKEEHMKWGTYKFDYEKSEVISFLISNLFFWIEEYHIDGFRVDGVSSMIYINYGVSDDKKYNKYGGEEDIFAIEFLKKMNETVANNYPEVFMIAEESAAWPLVTYPTNEGGLGFHYKWDMGWMHDTLEYFNLDKVNRTKSHNNLTFSTMYQHSENFILPLSHDEVVHGKMSIINRMYGGYDDKFKNLKLIYLYQITHMGRKLNFMGNELAQFIEWRYYEEIEWFLLKYPIHYSFNNYIRRLNDLYLRETTLWDSSCNDFGFEWIDADNANQSVITFIRRKKEKILIVVLNLQLCDYGEYIVGVPKAKGYKEIFNTLEEKGEINKGIIKTNNQEYQNQNNSLSIILPPLTGIVLKPIEAIERG
ncbi:MAG TPA: 1,4-alpha-glucan branching protein GlgB [Anaerovoracaceae bacterium]|nr:1,4-alpha-glucan branching protein GlgB [Anaerovoracaceae bacterium]